jgi:hypothetical protein
MGRASVGAALLALLLSACGVSWWDRVTGGAAAAAAAGFVGGDPGQPPPPGPGLPQLHHNPGDLFFTMAAGDEVFLRGIHTWPSVVDRFSTPFDFADFLAELKAGGGNFTRLWAADHDNEHGASGPFPFLQTSPGVFDLSRINQAHIDRWVARVAEADARGVYVSLMMFNAWDWHQSASSTTSTNPYSAGNNVNGLSLTPEQVMDPNGAAVPYHLALVRTLVNATKGYGNVLYEVANEPDNSSAAWAWQEAIASAIREADDRDHPVGITSPGWWFDGKAGINRALDASTADWVSYDGIEGEDGYSTGDPAAATGQKVSMLDTDHVWGIGGDADTAWRWFTRGHNVLSMDSLNGLGVAGSTPWSPGAADEAEMRLGIRQVGMAAGLMNLNDARVLSSRSSEGFLIGNTATGNFAGYDPDGGTVTVNLAGVTGKLDVYFFDVDTGAMTQVAGVAGGASRTLTAPSPGSQGFVLVADGRRPRHLRRPRRGPRRATTRRRAGLTPTGSAATTA